MLVRSTMKEDQLKWAVSFGPTVVSEGGDWVEQAKGYFIKI